VGSSTAIKNLFRFCWCRLWAPSSRAQQCKNTVTWRNCSALNSLCKVVNIAGIF
jgi:hypothetical protein